MSKKSCGPAAFDKADRLLNSFYQAAIQSAWLAARDTTCELAVSFGALMNGSDACISECHARLTMQRIEDLKNEIGGYVE
ncbi:lysozyme inhibitor LprI family protein [Albirhodobacter sp. R86504]|uniref:lysozyme inhibitor LprI family protein n=1 Tax=Albirhodobacter sp. R86504 TaxID=3093848 RepID=UPI00366CA333